MRLVLVLALATALFSATPSLAGEPPAVTEAVTRTLILQKGDVVRLVPAQAVEVRRVSGESVGLEVHRDEGTSVEIVAKEVGVTSVDLNGDRLRIEVLAPR